jgi:hypothetical protein
MTLALAIDPSYSANAEVMDIDIMPDPQPWEPPMPCGDEVTERGLRQRERSHRDPARMLDGLRGSCRVNQSQEVFRRRELCSDQSF